MPAPTRACLSGLDGVLTAPLHAAAWREMFDAYPKGRSQGIMTPFVTFDPLADHDAYVGGRSRADGAASSLGSAKNDTVLRRIRHAGVQAEGLSGKPAPGGCLAELLGRT